MTEDNGEVAATSAASVNAIEPEEKANFVSTSEDESELGDCCEMPTCEGEFSILESRQITLSIDNNNSKLLIHHYGQKVLALWLKLELLTASLLHSRED